MPTNVCRQPGVEFIGRFLLHVLPRGFKRIRHYGLLSPARKKAGLAAARAALDVPPPQPAVIETVGDFMCRVARLDFECCPQCGTGRFRVTADEARRTSRADSPVASPAGCAGGKLHCRSPRSPCSPRQTQPEDLLA